MKQDIYRECPLIENERFLLRLVAESDVMDLLKVYGNKNALPFFNSDNCGGDNFYYPTEERMLSAIRFWLREYGDRFYIRFAIVEKSTGEAVGTIELFNRKAEDFFNNCGLLRLDLRPDYENSGDISAVLSLILKPAYELFECDMIATKARNYAVDRIEALKEMGFVLSEERLIGHSGEQYDSYWTVSNI